MDGELVPLGKGELLLVGNVHAQLVHFAIQVRAVQAQLLCHATHVAAKLLDGAANVVGLELHGRVGKISAQVRDCYCFAAGHQE